MLMKIRMKTVIYSRKKKKSNKDKEKVLEKANIPLESKDRLKEEKHS